MRSYAIAPRIQQLLAWGPTRLLLVLFCSFEVRGIRNLDGLTQAIFAVNHASELDPIILTAALNPLGRFAPMFYIAGPSDSFNVPMFGWRRYLYTTSWFFKSWGAFPHIPGHKNYERSLHHHIRILRHGYSVCIFPEGRKTVDGKLGTPRGGVSFLSHHAHVPVVPVAITGQHRMNIWRFLLRRRRVTIMFGKPLHMRDVIPHPEPTPDHFKEAAVHVMKEIEQRITEVLSV